MHLPELVGSSGLLVLAATNAPVKPWISRKIVHMGIGTLLLNADISDPIVVNSIYAIGSTVAVLTTVQGLNHISEGRKTDGFIKDIGIFGYVMSCCICLLLSVPYSEITPLFYSDPAGAIIGRTIDSPKIWENKTIAGTTAVIGTTFITTHGDIPEKITVSIIVALIELFGGKIDNSLIASFLIIRYLIENNIK